MVVIAKKEHQSRGPEITEGGSELEIGFKKGGFKRRQMRPGLNEVKVQAIWMSECSGRRNSKSKGCT